jgi:hypothetical protein
MLNRMTNDAYLGKGITYDLQTRVPLVSEKVANGHGNTEA